MEQKRLIRKRCLTKNRIPNIEYALDLPILSVDPALTSGYAVSVRGEVRRSGFIKGIVALGGYSAPAATSIARIFREVVAEFGKVLLVIEDQYPRPTAQKALFREIEARAVWEAMALIHDCRVSRVGPSTWQSVEGIKGQREDRKAAACSMAGVADDNEADAILLGRYAHRIARVMAAKEQ